MNPPIVICAVGILFALLTFELVRRKYLRPEYALLWAALAAFTIVVAFVPGVVEFLTWLTHMNYLSVIVVLVFVFTAVMLMNFSVIASNQGDRIVRLTQEVALLRLEIDRLRNERAAARR